MFKRDFSATPGLRSSARLLARATGATLAIIALGASAQMRMPTGESYVGLQVGQTRGGLPCMATFPCDRGDTSVKATLGHMLTPYYGLELGYLDAGRVMRGGGDTRARAGDFSLVGRLPFDRFAVFGKVGAAYSRTTSNASFGSGWASGTASGWRPSYAAGVSYDLTPNWTAVAEWQRVQMRFVGNYREDVDNASVGVNFRF